MIGVRGGDSRREARDAIAVRNVEAVASHVDAVGSHEILRAGHPRLV